MYVLLARILVSHPVVKRVVFSVSQTLRAALHSNQTFSRLAEKLDILAVSSHVLQSLTSRTFGEGTMASFKAHVYKWSSSRKASDVIELGVLSRITFS